MKRSTLVVLGVGFLTVCGGAYWLLDGGEQYDEVCVNQETMIRVQDSDCESEHEGHHWYYMSYPRFGSLPPHPIGSKVTTSGSFTKPATGAFSRGGFGGVRGGSGGG